MNSSDLQSRLTHSRGNARQRPAPPRGPGGRSVPGAFTLIELLVVITIITILAAMLLPVLSRAKQKVQGIACINHLKQLNYAWHMYAGDHNDRLVPNISNGSGHLAKTADDPYAQPGMPYASWVLGDFNSNATASTDPDFVRNGLLFSYVKNLGVYRCPADQKKGANGEFTTRSMSLNGWMGTINPWKKNCLVFLKYSDIIRPTPANCFVFVDENPGTINDGYFLEDPNAPKQWVDLPAAYHNAAGGMSFADGHAEIRKWTDYKVRAGTYGTFSGKDPNSGDLPWLLERTTALR